MAKWACAIIGLGLGFSGCSGQGAGAPEATQGGSPVTTSKAANEGNVVFSDKNADGVELRVIDFGSGVLGANLSGPLSAKLPEPSGATLEDLYHAIRPDVSQVPAALAALSQRVEAMRPAALSTPIATTTPSGSAIIDKSNTAFQSTLCHTFTEGSPPTIAYVARECVYQDSHRNGALINDTSIHFYDRTYGWNNSPSYTTLAWSGTAGSYSYSVQPFWWTWMSVYGTGVDVFWADIWVTNGGEVGTYNPAYDFGITRHQYSAL
jgi:hypothetical protein